MTDLTNKNILITGATSGIGEACAYLFAKHGASRLILCGRRDERLQALKERLSREYQTKIFTLCFDITNHESVNVSLQTLPADFKYIDILINSAGGSLGMEKMDEAFVDDWEQMLDTNVKGTLYLIRELLPGMYARKSGHIVNLGSTASHNIYSGGSVYCASKFAVNAISKTLNLEAHGQGVRVTEIDPGMVETEFSLVRFKGDAKKAKEVYQKFKPLVAADVADVILFAITRPAHVNIAEIILYSREQSIRIPV